MWQQLWNLHLVRIRSLKDVFDASASQLDLSGVGKRFNWAVRADRVAVRRDQNRPAPAGWSWCCMYFTVLGRVWIQSADWSHASHLHMKRVGQRSCVKRQRRTFHKGTEESFKVLLFCKIRFMNCDTNFSLWPFIASLFLHDSIN